jgi:hypothetical protein
MPNSPELEDIRLEDARRRVEARLATVKENTAFLVQALQEIKRGGRDQ